MDQVPVISHRRTLFWLGLIVLLGLALRLTGLYWGQGYNLVGQADSLEAYEVAVDYAHGEAQAQYLGQPKFNDHAKLPGPLWSLFCVLGLRLWGTAEGAVLELILLNTAAIGLIYLLAQRTLGSPAALWAALLAATLPFPVFYSVPIFNPNVMVFLGAGLFLALWTVIERERTRCVFWLPLVVLVIPHFHMSLLALLPALGLILLLARPRLNWPWLLAGLLAGLLLYVPYVTGELHHGWQNTLGMRSLRSGFRPGCFKALTVALSVLTNWVPQWTDSWAEYRQLGRACFGWFGLFLAVNVLSAVLGLLLLGRVVLEVKGALGQALSHRPKTARRTGWRLWDGLWAWAWGFRPLQPSPGPAEPGAERARALLFLAILVGVPLGLASVNGKNYRTHYVLVLLPALLSLVGGAVVRWRATPRVGRAFTLALGLLLCANVWFMPALFYHQGVRITRGPSFLGSFRQLEAVYRQLKQHAGPNRSVQVEDRAYLQSYPQAEQDHLEAKFLRPYVTRREQDVSPASGPTTAPVCYQLCRAEDVQADDRAVAYRAHGIALKRVAP